MRSFFTIFATFLLVLQHDLAFSLGAGVKIGISTGKEYVGDREIAWRIKIAAERLGWDVVLDEDHGKHIQKMSLDWVICMLPNNEFFNPNCPNYLMIFHPFTYLDEKRMLNSAYEKYDGYLLTVRDRETLRDGLQRVNRLFHFIPFFPTVPSILYKEVSTNNLVVMIPVWGNRLNNEKFRNLHSILSRTGYAKFYGVHPNQDIISNGYMGSIPFDGISVIDVLHKHGIVLVIHSAVHNQEGIPSGRIFEATAASNIVISDENSFVKEHFGDSVFYIDTTGSFESIFEQIQEHMMNIQLDPETALDMAKRAHQIFIDKFTMESQLLSLQKMHQKVIESKKK